MSPNAIRRNVDQLKRLRKHADEARRAGKDAVARSYQADADRIARSTAAAVRASSSLAPRDREDLLHTLEAAQ